MIVLLALAGPTSAAGVTVHADAALPTGETRSFDLYADETGGYYVLVDGKPVDPSTVGLPGLPGLPGAPGVPAVPGVPGVPSPGAPSLPGVPGLPALPVLP